MMRFALSVAILLTIHCHGFSTVDPIARLQFSVTVNNSPTTSSYVKTLKPPRRSSSAVTRANDWQLRATTSDDDSSSSQSSDSGKNETSTESDQVEESIPESDEPDSGTAASDSSASSAANEGDGAEQADDASVATTLSPTDNTKLSFRERIRKLWWKNEDSTLTTRQRLAKMGLAAVLSYGWVSNMSYVICISIAWYGFSKKTGLSPLAPDQWKPFLAVYAGFWVFNNVIRPLRLGLSIAISQYFDNVVAYVQRKTNFNKGISIALVVFVLNVVGTIGLMCVGIFLASLASGVPVFPGKQALS